MAYTGIYKEMYDAGWRLVYGSWANPDALEKLKMDWIHVYPVNDLKEHKLIGLDCRCQPKINWDDLIVTHNSWDGREIEEWVNTKENNG